MIKSLALVCLLALPCCSRDAARIAPTPQAPVAEISVPRAIKDTLQVRDFVVKIECKTPDGVSLGTAFVHSSGLVITAAHVVARCLGDTVQISKNARSKAARVRVRNDLLDLALLDPATPEPTGLKLVDVASVVAFGDTVVAYGYPVGYTGVDAMVTVGYVAGTGVVKTGASRVFVNGNFNSGNSGGPVIDVQSGRVLGVVSAKVGGVSPHLKAAVATLSAQTASRKMKTIVDGQEVEFLDTDVLQAVVDHLESQVQLGIGVMVTPGDLSVFLARNGVVP